METEYIGHYYQICYLKVKTPPLKGCCQFPPKECVSMADDIQQLGQQRF